MSLPNEQIEERMQYFAEGLERMSELTATVFEQRDKQIAELSDRIQALEKPAD